MLLVSIIKNSTVTNRGEDQSNERGIISTLIGLMKSWSINIIKYAMSLQRSDA